MLQKKTISIFALLILMVLALLLSFVQHELPYHFKYGTLDLCLNKENQLLAEAFCIMAFLLIIHSISYIKTAEVIGTVIYSISAIFILLSNNLLTTLLAWEAAALGAIVILASGSKDIGPVLRYAAMHFVGGTFILAALSYDPAILHSSLLKSIEYLDAISTLLLAIGILINCAAFPVSTWVTDSYPAATPHGTAILQLYVTKSALFILFIIFQNYRILVPIGMITAIYALVYSVWQDRVRVILAYNTVGQIGLIIAGIGFGANIVPYLFSSIIYQTALYMSITIVIRATGKEKLQDVGGLFKKMPIIGICSIVALLSMSAVPLTMSFNAKMLITHSIDSPLALILFLCINSGLIISCGIRTIYFTFFHKPKYLNSIKKDGVSSNIVAVITTLFCVVPVVAVESAYSLKAVLEQLAFFAFACIIFYLIRFYKLRGEIHNIDCLYRVFLVRFLLKLESIIIISWRKIVYIMGSLLQALLSRASIINISTVSHTILLAVALLAIIIGLVLKYYE